MRLRSFEFRVSSFEFQSKTPKLKSLWFLVSSFWFRIRKSLCPVTRNLELGTRNSSIDARLASEIFLSSLLKLLKRTFVRVRSGEWRVASVEFQPETRNRNQTVACCLLPVAFRRLTSSASRLLLLLLALVILGAAPVEKKLKEPKITVSTHVDKTAIWVGDTLRYTVRAIHDPDIEFVLDSLKKESLNLTPFVVREVTMRQGSFAGNKKVTEVTLQLATYESGQPELRIPSFVLYFFTHKPGSEKRGDTLAESFSVPASRVGLRSTLTADARRLRDSREIAPAGSQRWMGAFALGFVGMTFLGVQTARRLWASPSIEKPKKQQLTRRARRRLLRDFLRASQSIGRDSAEDQQRFYAEVSRFVREYLGVSLEIDASGMTPDELARILDSQGKNGLGAPVKTLLERCEQVLYTPRGAEMGREWRDEVQSELGRLARSLRM